MVNNVGTAQTQAVQLWLNKTAAELGYSNQLPIQLPIPIEELAFVSGYLEPFDTYADMSQVLDKEASSAAAGVQQVAYFCNVLPDSKPIPPPAADPNFPAREYQRVKDFALNFFRQRMTPATRLEKPGWMPSFGARTSIPRSAMYCRCRERRSTGCIPRSPGSKTSYWRETGLSTTSMRDASKRRSFPDVWRLGPFAVIRRPLFGRLGLT
jgi:hypothetical protein